MEGWENGIINKTVTDVKWNYFLDSMYLKIINLAKYHVCHDYLVPSITSR